MSPAPAPARGARTLLPPLVSLKLLLTALLTTTLGLGVLGALPARTSAAPGPAPDPAERRVIADVHTDAIATFWEDGALVLATRADTPDPHTRYPADRVWFHVDDDSRRTAPASRPFIAPAGAEVWIAPQGFAADQLWPGFSTESVPDGTLDANTTTMTLVDVAGPGDVELYQNDIDGAIRQWSSDEDVKAFDLVGRSHMHTNWAFTAAGIYHLTVRASGTVAGQQVEDTAVYTFVVGELPEQVATETAVQIEGDSTVTVGTPVELRASVSPATVEGYVEFRDGTTVLGHEAVVAGAAALTVDALAIGSHDVTAVFVPSVANLAATSSSQPVTVSVTDEGGVPFAVTGVEASYAPGDLLSAEVVGVTLAESQMYRWLWRPIGSTSTGLNVQTSTSSAYTRSPVLGASDDGYELSVAVRQCANETCSSGSIVAQAGWYPVHVEQAGQRPSLTRVGGSGPIYPGDLYRLEAGGLDLAEGETTEFVYRLGVTWSTRLAVSGSTAAYPDPASVTIKRVGDNANAYDVAVRVVRDGVPVRQSEPHRVQAANFELPVQGLQTLYFEGASADLSAQIHPVRDGDAFTYEWQFSKAADFAAADPSTVVWAAGSQSPATVEKTVNVADHDKGYLRLRVLTPDGVEAFRTPAVRIYVTDDPDAQLFFLNQLAEHYHQGDAVSLASTVAPEPLPGDEIRWEWKWADRDWEPFPGASGKQHRLTAEQALDGVQVRVILDFAAEGKDSIVAEPVTIQVDDHGAAARQQPTITGRTSAIEGETTTLTRELPENGPTVLTEHRWERRAAGSEEWTTLADEVGETLGLTATAADDGAAYRVSVVKPNGVVAYGPSPEVTLAVEAAPTGPPPSGPAGPSGVAEPGADPVVKATPVLKVRVSRPTVRRGGSVVVRVRVRAGARVPSGAVRVRVAGRVRTVHLDERGRARIRVRIAKSVPPGTKRVAVIYRGDGQVAAARDRSTRVRVRR